MAAIVEQHQAMLLAGHADAKDVLAVHAGLLQGAVGGFGKGIQPFLGVLLALGGLAAWYFRLQVVQHAEYATRSEANRLRMVPVVPARIFGSFEAYGKGMKIPQPHPTPVARRFGGLWEFPGSGGGVVHSLEARVGWHARGGVVGASLWGMLFT